MKKWIVVLLLIGIAGAAGYFWGLPHLKSWQAKAEASRSPGMLTTAVVEQRDIHFTVMAAGDIGPAEQVSVRPEINGRIQT
jgi:multidrug efflux pump subunit AcrA (membrane-fusion protein)